MMDVITEKGSDDTMVLHVAALVGVGDLEQDHRVELHSNVERHPGDETRRFGWNLRRQSRSKTAEIYVL